VAAADDPVEAFLSAHEHGRPVALTTSATAGRSRTVVRSTESWVCSFPVVGDLVGLTPTSRVWVPGPLRATMNLFAAVHAAWAGAALVDSPTEATHAQLTPGALATALDRDLALDGLTVVVAGDRLSPAVHARAVAGGALVHHYYGAAELSFVAWGDHADDLRPFPGVEVAVRDGEIWVRSPYLCSGYDGPPGALRRGGDGFVTVGDRGLLSAGRLVVLGRPDAVTTGGETVVVAEVEGVLRASACGEVVVIGVPHPTLGAVLAVVLTRADDHAPALTRARERLVGALRPRLWFHVPVLPMTPAGKVDRDALVSSVSRADGTVRRLV
jgi:acyl-CoA synthetase (AMP-forming)/AMP-acid ligase II